MTLLARAATEAGLGDALARSPHLDYAGYSAGACLTSIDLRGIHMTDEESARPSGYRAEMPAKALNLTGTRLVPHAGSDEASAAVEYLRGHSLGFIELADGDDKLMGMPFCSHRMSYQNRPSRLNSGLKWTTVAADASR